MGNLQHEKLEEKASAKVKRLQKILDLLEKKVYWTKVDIREGLDITKSRGAKATKLDRDLIDLQYLGLVLKVENERCPSCGHKLKKPGYHLRHKRKETYDFSQ